MRKMFAWREIEELYVCSYQGGSYFSEFKVDAIKAGYEIIITLRKIQNSIKYFLPAVQLKSF